MFPVRGMSFSEFARTMLGSGSFIAIFSGIVGQGWLWRWRFDIIMNENDCSRPTHLFCAHWSLGGREWKVSSLKPVKLEHAELNM